MKKNLVILLVACFAFNAHAQLLWKVSGHGLSKPSYILGTHHLASLSIIDSIKGLQSAFDATTQIIGELKISDVQSPTAMQLMQQEMMIQNDTTLQVLFTPEQYGIVNNFTKENLGFDLSQMPKVKPAFILNNAVVVLYMKHVGNFKPQEQLDTYFQTKGIEKGKKITALETLNFQFNLLYNGTSLRRQAELLLCELNNVDKLIDDTKKLTTAYMIQDLDGMYKLSEEKEGTSCDPLPGEMEAMITNRNKDWAAKLPALMTADPSFVVVGALHLPGKEGLLNLLKKQGYSIEAVK
ncbi:TraB/GumN family protein [uncultured Bacteroides sp.]|uniref:TraB/GumN family protein n=1 Tax=uncultured Bacteroides sp. TaxID=162156 RepID=UPI002AA7A4FA|nr:TraB/GumN family protein [uncultured Bacteroides sp.]